MLESIPYSVVVIAAVALSAICVLAALLHRFGRIVPERGAVPLLVLVVAAVLYGGPVAFQPDRGRVVSVTPSQPGDHTLQVSIAGFTNAPPQVSFRAYQSESVVDAHFVYVCDSSGAHPGGIADLGADATNRINGVNRVFRQAGMRFRVADICTTNRNEWFSIDLSKDVEVQPWNPELLFAYPTTWGVRIFVINNMYLDQEQNVYFASSPCDDYGSFGVLLPAYMDNVALSHEIGHVCGLLDVYSWDVNNDDFSFQDFKMLSPSQSLFPMDSTGPKTYYGVTRIGVLIDRLLMCGFVTDENKNSHVDVSLGQVKGIVYSTNDDCEVNFSATGLSNLIRTPAVRGSTR